MVERKILVKPLLKILTVLVVLNVLLVCYWIWSASAPSWAFGVTSLLAVALVAAIYADFRLSKSATRIGGGKEDHNITHNDLGRTYEKQAKASVQIGVLGALFTMLYGVLVNPYGNAGNLAKVFVVVAVFGLFWWLSIWCRAQLKKQKVRENLDHMATKATDLKDTGLKVADQQMLPKLWYLFSFSGRIKRLEYLIVQFVAGLALAVLFIATLEDPTDGVSLIAYLLMLVVVVSLASFGARRTRDTGVNQWWYLLIFIPPVNIAGHFFLLLVPTDEFRDARI